MSEAKTWVLASHNQGKIKEIADLLAPFGIQLQSAADFSLPEPEETEPDFAGNAILKARAASEATGLPALADDSGLCVTALDGAPGIYSARWAGEPRDFGVAMRRVHDELEQCGSADRSAAFVCVLALAFSDGAVRTFEGRVSGEIVWPPRGDGGFGYDPVFRPEGESRVFAEMSREEKAGMSHRARALARLVAEEFGDD
ncbi:RdgB/HAM1 family non-canonical purine NTP pyrophosphatase [Hyphobacterium sp. HN65]|uniref:dITP/XTP pyrophosphatase n=1 Tax=Hyphobacterium lacteum TaxID=3116575 RepID=A0ABU7LSP3_9PROT|nr:RdgB/HAM1 family non-canonical purine NTP pyrophosphatase [Hyphobacterium sp. HN65]MEE2526666.1 RdgB/HAM1 family non-canonical purine NTP pyrophosphatase [Hyphobacterium sp. HN65]